MPTTDVGALFEATIAASEPATTGSAEVFSRAGRIQRRQRLRAGLGAVAVLGVTASVLGAVGAGQLGLPGPAAGERAGGQTVPGPPGNPPAPGVAARPGASPSPSEQAGGGTVSAGTPEQILETLIRLLPAGAKTSAHLKEAGFARLVLTDRLGKTTIQVNVQPDFPRPGDPANKGDLAAKVDGYGCDQEPGATAARDRSRPGTSCESERLPGGILLMSTGGEDPHGAAGVVGWTAEAIWPDGLRVVATVWNAVRVKAGPPTRTEPGVTSAELRRIVISPQWRY